MALRCGFICVTLFVFAYISSGTGKCPCSSQELCKPIKDTTRKEVFMFSLHDDPHTWKNFNYTKVTTIVMVGYISPELMCYAHQRNTRVAIIANYDTADLTNTSKRQAWIQEKLTTVQNEYLDGINIDYESPISQAQTDLRNGYTSLVKETYQAFKKALPNYQVTVDVAWSPACIDGRCYDYKALAQFTDFLFIMAYDEQSQITGECIAMANSGYTKTLAGLKGYLSIEGITPSRLVLGLPWYGYQYKCLSFSAQNNKCQIKHVPFRGVPCSDAAGSQHDYSVIMKQLHSAGTHVMFDNNTMTPFINYQDLTTQDRYQIWFDDPRSLKLKYQMATDLDLRGVGIWNADSLDYSNISQVNSMWEAFPTYPRVSMGTQTTI